jgi:AraC-like DNA-binding protein
MYSLQAAEIDAPSTPQDGTRPGPASYLSASGFDLLFQHLPGVCFFVKDDQGRFTRVNQAFSKLVRVRSPEQVIGARDADFFPSDLAEGYVRDDQLVIESLRPIVDKLELIRLPNGGSEWLCTTKLPLLDAEGRAIGVCGVTRVVDGMPELGGGPSPWAGVIETMLKEYGSPLRTEALARQVSLSVSQFNRQFRKRFGMAPHEYLSDLRLNAAAHLLVTTELTVSEVAQRTGFYDQSHLTNGFVRARGISPSKYRAKHAQRNVVPLTKA